MVSLHRFLPPPVVLVLIALVMWGIARVTPAASLWLPGATTLALIPAIAAGIIMALAAWQFRAHRTTINPMRPEDSDQLIRTGIYRYSRNSIYLADALLLAAWAIYLANPVAALGVPVFMGLIQRYQIRPEEAALTRRFGAVYTDYMNSVRRWL